MLKKFKERIQNLQERLNNQTAMWVHAALFNREQILPKLSLQKTKKKKEETVDPGRFEHKATSDGEHSEESFCKHEKSINGRGTSWGI